MKAVHIKKKVKNMKRNTFLILLMFGVMLISCTNEPEYIYVNHWGWLEKDTPPNTGPSPNYGDLFYWAASPRKQDLSDGIPDFLKGEERTELADVFFVHPTTYVGSVDNIRDDEFNAGFRNSMSEIRRMSWNADLTDEKINRRTDERVIYNQATVFNGSCRIYAPRYRQASLKAFLTQDVESAQKAFNLAYSDIRTAFEYYLKYENAGRPIVIASHSQGTKHAIRLMQEYFDGQPLQTQLVCAYLVGWRIPYNTLKSIPLSVTPDAIGGFVGWRSYREGEIPKLVMRENGDSQCVNPLTWTDCTDVFFKETGNSVVVNGETVNAGDIYTSVDASAKILWVSFSGTDLGNIGDLKNLHTFDYNLFWMEVRKNVKYRIEVWRGANADK
jgi:hypothetical protein